MSRSDGAAALVCAAALLAFLVLAVGDVVETSPTTDEGVHLAAGYSYLARADYRLNPEHPPLLKKVAALPLLAMKPWGFDRSDDAALSYAKLQEAWASPDALAQWDVQHYFFWGLRDRWFGLPPTERLPREAFVNPTESMFTRARLMLLLTGVLLAVVVFVWSRALWGMWGAALSVLLFCFDPNFIAHCGLVTTDAGVALLMFAAVFFFWRVCERFSWLAVAGFAVCFGLAQTAKFSAVLLVPVVLVLAVHSFLRRRNGRELLLALGVGALATVGIIWAVYGFRFAASEGTAQPMVRVVEDWYATQALLPTYPEGPPDAELARARLTTPVGFAGKLLLRAKEWHVLPEAYVYGLAVVRRSGLVRESYLRGEFSTTGFRSYFLWTFLYKTPLVALLAIAFSLLAARRVRTTALPFLLWPALLYLAISMQQNLNLGQRHILPIYPFLYVVCGALAVTWKRRRLLSFGVAAVCIVLTAVVVPVPRVAPLWGHHLSYMNAFAGGPFGGHERLLDSNYVWGQDLEALGRWVSARGIREPINLVYSSMAEPRYYGIAYQNLQYGYWSEPQLPPSAAIVPGYLAIDADRLHGLGMDPSQRTLWPQFLADHKAREVGRAGYSIFIYRLE